MLILILFFIVGLYASSFYINGLVKIEVNHFTYESTFWVFVLVLLSIFIICCFVFQILNYCLNIKARIKSFLRRSAKNKGTQLLEEAYINYTYEVFDSAFLKAQEAYKLIPDNTLSGLLYAKLLLKANKKSEALEILTEKRSFLFDFLLLKHFTEYKKNPIFLQNLYKRFPNANPIKKAIHQYNITTAQEKEESPIEEIYKYEKELYSEFLWSKYQKYKKFDDLYSAWKNNPKQFYFALKLLENTPIPEKRPKYLEDILYYLDEPILIEKFFAFNTIENPVERFNFAKNLTKNKKYLSFLAHEANLIGMQKDLGIDTKTYSTNFYFQCTQCCNIQKEWTPFCQICEAHSIKFKKD